MPSARQSISRLALLLCAATVALAQSNGAYAVLREGVTRAEADPGKEPHITILYDHKYVEAAAGDPDRYISLATNDFVPLRLAGAPQQHTDANGRPMLEITLAREHVKTLEDFTRKHLGGKIALVIDREIVTLHTVRAVVTDGRAVITRCTDNACEILRVKLAK